MYETAVVSATEKCSLGAKIPKMSLQAYDSIMLEPACRAAIERPTQPPAGAFAGEHTGVPSSAVGRAYPLPVGRTDFEPVVVFGACASRSTAALALCTVQIS